MCLPELQRYHEMGLTLVPITVKDGEKQPLVEYKGYRDNPQDLPTLQGLHETYKDVKPLHWAVYCINNVIGLDFETEAEYLAFFGDVNTLTTRSPHGGYHAFIRGLTPCKGFAVLGIEIKVNMLCTVAGEGYAVYKDLPVKEFEDAGAFLDKKFPKLKVDKNVKDIKIKDVISKYVDLRPQDKDHIYQGRCPIHGDTDHEHLYVYENTGSWYCFRCSKGGNAIDFIKAYKKIPKSSDAYNFLCELLGLTSSNGDEEVNVVYKSTVRLNNVLYEQVNIKDGYKFVSFSGSGFEYHDELTGNNNNNNSINTKYCPCVDEEVLKGLVVLPNAPVDYA